MNFRKRLISFTALLFCIGQAGIAAAQSTSMLPQDQQSYAFDPQSLSMSGVFSELPTDHILGEKDAPITMIIYASITCPHCAHWFTGVWPDIKANYVDTGKLRIVYREFITAPAQLAFAGFQIANCAPEDQYFSLIEHQMKEQDNIIKGVQDGKGLDTYLAIAKMAGLNNEQEMNTCFDNKAGRDRMDLAMKLATEGNIPAVPGFIVNGSTYKDSADYLPLSKYFESLLTQEFSVMPK